MLRLGARSRTVLYVALISAFFVACTDEQPLAPGDRTPGGGPEVGKPLFDHAPAVLSAVVDVNNYFLTLQPALLPFGAFKGVGTLFAGALAYGNSPASVFFYNTGFGTADFAGTGLPIEVLTPGPVADHQTLTLMGESPTDALGPTTPLGLLIARETFAYVAAPDDDYVIIKYTLFNTGEEAVAGLHIGQIMDHDLAFFLDDIVEYDATNEVAIVSSDPSDTVHAGHALLSDPPTSYRGWSNVARGGPPPLDPSTNADWFDFLSGGIVDAAPFGPGDIRHLLSHGPVTIGPGASRVVALVLVAGDDRADLLANVAAARARYAALPLGARAPHPLIAVDVQSKLRPGEFHVKLTFPSEDQLALFDQSKVFCGGAAPIKVHTPIGLVAKLTFELSDFPRFRDGDALFCVGKLTDGTLFGGRDVPKVKRPLVSVTQLTFDPAEDRSPTWSPDGQSIAFASVRGGSFAIWRMEIAGGEASAVQLTFGGPFFDTERHPDWSPDGSKIVFSRDGGIFAFDVTAPPLSGGGLTQLTPDGVAATFDQDPRWSPDGTQIAFRRASDIVPGHHVWVMTSAGELGAGGAPAIPVATHRSGNDISPYWATDGLIYFASFFRPGDLLQAEVYSVDPAVGEPAARVTLNEQSDNRHPAVSPDGSTLAFISSSGGVVDLVLQDLATADHTVVLFPPPVGALPLTSSGSRIQNLEYSPDGGQILFVAAGDIWVADISGL